ncbi:unnamed protein product, partial [Ixodes pacificus]
AGIISGALLQLKDTFGLSCVTQQLVVGSLFLGAFLASFVGGVLVDLMGRKRALLLASLLFLTGTALQSLSPNLAVLVCGRLFTGMAVSLSTTAECTYIAEISPPAQRGLLVSLNEVAITIGFLLAYTVNYAFISRQNGWQFMFAVATCPALLQLVGTMFLPQSPHYLMLKGRNDKARKVLQLIHGEEAGVVEMQHMQKSLGDEQNQRYRDLVSPSLRGRMLVGMGLVFLQQFTGQTNVVYYAPTLLKHLGFCTNVAATLASVGLGVVKVIAAIFALLVLDRAGRRFCLCAGILLMMISILTLGLLTKSSFGTGQVVAIRCRDTVPLVHHSNVSSSVTSHVTSRVTSQGPRVTSRGSPVTRSQRHHFSRSGHSGNCTAASIGSEASDSVCCDCSSLALIGHLDAKTYSVEGVSGMSTPASQADVPQLITEGRTHPGRDALPEQLSCFNSSLKGGAVIVFSSVSDANGPGFKGQFPTKCFSNVVCNRVQTRFPQSRFKAHDRSTRPIQGIDHIARGSDTVISLWFSSLFFYNRDNDSNSTLPVSEFNEGGHCSGSSQASTLQRAVTLAALMSYVFAYGVSFGTTTWLVLSEIFPMAVRGRAISVAASMNWAANMAVSASFLTLLGECG